jgi:hypothetical protein
LRDCIAIGGRNECRCGDDLHSLLYAIPPQLIACFRFHVDTDRVVTAWCVACACEGVAPLAGFEVHAAAALHVVVRYTFAARGKTHHAGAPVCNATLCGLIERPFKPDAVRCVGSVIEGELPKICCAKLVWWGLLEFHLHLCLREMEYCERNKKDNDASSFHGILL